MADGLRGGEYVDSNLVVLAITSALLSKLAMQLEECLCASLMLAYIKFDVAATGDIVVYQSRGEVDINTV